MVDLVKDLIVRITFNDESTLDVTADTYLIGYNMLMEMDNSNEKITGKVTSNEFSFALDNQEGIFTPTNTESPYFGKIEEGLKIEVLTPDRPLGVFYVTEWKAPSTGVSSVANITAVDRLQNVINTSVSVLDIDKNIPLKDFLVKVFASVGIPETDLIIDPSLTQVLNYTVVNGSKLSSVLDDISISGDCYIYVNLDNKIVVRGKNITGEPVHFVDDETDVRSITPSESILNSTNTLVINYSATSLTDVKEVLNLSQIEVASGESTLDNFEVDGGNLYNVDNVKVLADNNTRCKGVKASQNTISLNMVNPDPEPVLCDIKVYGRKIESTTASVTKSDEASVSKVGIKELKIDSKLTQDKSDADNLLNTLWSRVIKTTPYMTSVIELDDFTLSLGDIIQVDAGVLNTSYRGYLHSIKFTWIGGNVITAEVGIKSL